jgi:2-amino-4-hydroxy-6-hydroxymethyldihydropteridine diphosphokinase
MSTTAYIGLGSNLGDRRDYLERALLLLQQQPCIEVGRVSRYHETAPVGGPPGQGNYLNAAAEVQTTLDADELLNTLMEVEAALGRVRSEWHGPRTIDLDLLLYGSLIREQPGLIVPHPRIHERFFVLEPLAEIAPHVIHPCFGCTVLDLLHHLRAGTMPEPSAGSTPAAGAGELRSGVSAGSGNPRRAPPADPRRAHEGEPHPLSLPTGARGPGRELAGLRAMVTGSTSGIGRAIALELADAGADVLVHGRRLAAAEAVAEQIRDRGVRSETVIADLRETARLPEVVAAAWDEWGGLDIWVNNAGADTLTGEAQQWPFEQKLHELLAVDVTATVLLSREVGRHMKARGGGVLLNMGWDQAATGMEGDSGELFAASKGAVMAFSKSLALSLAPEVRVNCLAPGWIRTAWGEGAGAPWQERVRRETPLRRWGTPADVAAVARWLVSPAAAFLTGQVVRVNGGAVR